ncbi:hypothetical protein XENOCAPTIV_016037, partial [Xenoophorus captivus]
ATPSAATGMSPALLVAWRALTTTVPLIEEKLQGIPLDRQLVQLKDDQSKLIFPLMTANTLHSHFQHYIMDRMSG